MKKKKYKLKMNMIPTIIVMTTMIILLGYITSNAINTYKNEKENDERIKNNISKEITKASNTTKEAIEVTPAPVVQSEPQMPEYNLGLSKELQEYTWNECKKYNWDNIYDGYKVCILVMFNESKFNPNAVNYNDNGTIDKGLFQINSSRIKSLASDLCIPIDDFDCFNQQMNIEAGVYYINTLYNNLSVYGNNDEQKVGATYMGLSRGGERTKNIIKANGVDIIYQYPYSQYTNKILKSKTQLEQSNSLK